MKTVAIVLLIMLFSMPVLAKPQDKVTSFIKAQRQAFSDSYGQRVDKGLLKEFGYGTGVYVNTDKDVTVSMPFEWYAYCGPDGFVMFQFNVVVSYQDRYKIMVETDQFSDRPWDAVSEENETRLNLDNKWIGCIAKKTCDYRAILDDYLVKFMRFPFFTEMKVTVYL